MRKSIFLLVLLLVLVAGCGKGQAPPISSPPPSPSPSPLPSPTPSPGKTASPTSEVEATPSGPATCVEAPFDFPTEPRIPPVTEEDHTIGSADAPITFIEYADFQ